MKILLIFNLLFIIDSQSKLNIPSPRRECHQRSSAPKVTVGILVSEKLKSLRSAARLNSWC